ncbi:MAG: hypothetical protein ACHQC8_06560 [Solirubrobacterales bacterium]
MSACPACGKSYRKGRLAVLLTHENAGTATESRRVCLPCAKGGITLVGLRLAPVVKQAAARPEGYARALRLLQAYARAARAAAADVGPEVGEFASGRAEAYEGAIEVLKREIGGEA